jgi:glycosyltransferase involved in cell wall biosynthesis
MSRKVIYINGRFCSQPVTGVQRYALNLIQALDKLIDGKAYKFILLAPRSVQKPGLQLKNISFQSRGYLSGHLWEQICLPIITFDCLLLNFCNTSPILKRKQIVTIHDGAVFRFSSSYNLAFVFWYRILFFFNRINGSQIITISQFSKSEIIRFIKIRNEKIEVILPSGQFDAREQDEKILEKHQLLPGKFILTVGSLDKKKNLKSVIWAFENLGIDEFDLVVVGGSNSKVFGDVPVQVNQKIKYTGYINDEELFALYANAYVFIFASFYEGFGLPPLEAMYWGLPVVASGTASIPEACGEAALYIDPHQPMEIVTSIRRIYNDPTYYEKMKKSSLLQSKRFSWESSAKQLLDFVIKFS